MLIGIPASRTVAVANEVGTPAAAEPAKKSCQLVADPGSGIETEACIDGAGPVEEESSAEGRRSVVVRGFFLTSEDVPAEIEVGEEGKRTS